jgi:glycosyltransferase involved in cell wall biosynthesis
MQIAVDARELCGRPTGVGRYLTALLEVWAESADARRHEWALYAHERPPVPQSFSDWVRVVPGSGGTKWQQWDWVGALRRDRPNVVFAPGYTAPLTSPAPTVLTIHDVSYFDHPEWFSTREGARLRWLTRWSARRARIVLTDSRFSQQQIVNHLAVPADRLRLIHLGARRPHIALPTRREPLVLYVGSIFERRHVDWLIEGFGQVASRLPGARLEIVGENRTTHPRRDLEALRRGSGYADRIVLRSYVDESTLADLYSRASVFAFLSEYEGFGLTPLEALAAGVPPVVLDTPIAREICGAAARYIRPSANHTELIDALVELLVDESHRRSLLDNAEATLARYDWNEAAKATLAAIEEGAGVE